MRLFAQPHLIAVSSSDGWLQHVFTPLAKTGPRRVLRSSTLAVVEPLAFGANHIGLSVGHRLRPAAPDELLFKGGVVGSLALHRLTEDGRHHRSHVVKGQIFRTQHRLVAYAGPDLIEQQEDRGFSNILGRAAGELARRIDR